MSLDVLKKALRVCIFMLDNSVHEAVVHWFRQYPKEIFTNGIH